MSASNVVTVGVPRPFVDELRRQVRAVRGEVVDRIVEHAYGDDRLLGLALDEAVAYRDLDRQLLHALDTNAAVVRVHGPLELFVELASSAEHRLVSEVATTHGLDVAPRRDIIHFFDGLRTRAIALSFEARGVPLRDAVASPAGA